jgi:hypothetical protein
VVVVVGGGGVVVAVVHTAANQDFESSPLAARAGLWQGVWPWVRAPKSQGSSVVLT